MKHWHRSRLQWAVLLALSLGMLTPYSTAAQPSGPQQAAAAQPLYEQATKEMDAKNYASACPKLEEVVRLVPDGVGARLELAECYEAWGKLASAWSQYAITQGLAIKDGQQQRAQYAQQRAAALKPLLATMKMEVLESTRRIPALLVTRDGVPVGAPQWGTALPVDAGAHEIVVTASGYVTWKKSVEVVTNGVEVTVHVPVLELDHDAPSFARATMAPVKTIVDRSWQRPVGMATMTVGAVGISTGMVLGSFALFKNSKSKENHHCDANNRCDETGLLLRQEALNLGYGSTASFVLGAALLVGGGVLTLAAPLNPKQKPRTTGFSLGLGGVALTGVW